MNRRDFGKLALGTGAAAALPLQGLASAAASTANRSKYIFAVALAHARTDVSAEMISETFGIRPHVARRYLSRLVRNGVVDAPDASGMARLTKPLQRIIPEVVEYNPAGGYIVKGPRDEILARAKDAARRVMDADPEDETAPPDVPGDEPEDDAPALA